MLPTAPNDAEHPSEILAREVETGDFADFSQDSVGLSTANAPWRDLARLEHHARRPFEVQHTLVWDTIVICIGPVALEQRLDDGPLQKIIAVPGDVHLYPSGVPIYARSTQTNDYLVLQLSPKALSALGSEKGNPPKLKVSAFRVERDPQLERMATLFEAELRCGCSSGRLYGESLAMALAAYVLHHYSDISEPAQLKGGLPGRSLNTVLDYIQSHLSKPISLEEMADLAQLSVFHFSRLFKQSTGLTPHRYVLQLRTEEAKRLLRSRNLHIAEIAQRVGFEDQSHFTAAFRKMTGTTPRRWRQTA